MKYLIILLIAIIGCDPFSVISTMDNLSSTSPVVDALLVDVVINAINDSTGEHAQYTVPITKLHLNNFIESQNNWIGEYKNGEGYALRCNYLSVTKSEDNLKILFFISKINESRYKWGYYNFPITNNQWDGIKHIFPKEKKNKLKIYISFED